MIEKILENVMLLNKPDSQGLALISEIAELRMLLEACRPGFMKSISENLSGYDGNNITEISLDEPVNEQKKAADAEKSIFNTFNNTKTVSENNRCVKQNINASIGIIKALSEKNPQSGGAEYRLLKSVTDFGDLLSLYFFSDISKENRFISSFFGGESGIKSENNSVIRETFNRERDNSLKEVLKSKAKESILKEFSSTRQNYFTSSENSSENKISEESKLKESVTSFFKDVTFAVTEPIMSQNISQSFSQGIPLRTPENSRAESEAKCYTDNSSYAPVFNLEINGSMEDRETERKVKEWISEAMDEVFESIAKKNKRIQEV